MLRILSDDEFTKAQRAFMNNKPFEGVSGYELEKALSNYVSGTDIIPDEAKGQSFSKESFDGEFSTHATVKKMNANLRR